MNKLATLCAAFLVAACHLVGAYDFQDSDFNQLLSFELEDIVESLYSAPLHPRARRDDEAANNEKCKKRHGKPKMCCAEESLISFLDEFMELAKDCFKEVGIAEKPDKHKKIDLFSCEAIEKRKSDITCVSQCIAKKRDLLTADGSPDANKIASFLKKTLSKESWIASSVDKIVATCIAEAKSAHENPPKFYTESYKVCNPTGITLRHCLFKEIQFSCPADQIKDQAACDKFRELVTKKGVEMYGPGIPFDGPKHD